MNNVQLGKQKFRVRWVWNRLLDEYGPQTQCINGNITHGTIYLCPIASKALAYSATWRLCLVPAKSANTAHTRSIQLLLTFWCTQGLYRSMLGIPHDHFSHSALPIVRCFPLERKELQISDPTCLVFQKASAHVLRSRNTAARSETCGSVSVYVPVAHRRRISVDA